MFTADHVECWLDIRDRSRALSALYDQYLAARKENGDTAELTSLYNEAVDALASDIHDFVTAGVGVHLISEATVSLPLPVAQDVAKRLKRA